MVTFRQLEILFGFTYGEGNLWNIKENELQRVWATIADGGTLLKVQGCQIRSPVLEICPQGSCNTFFARKATGTINEGEVKLLDMGIKPIISRTRMGRRSEETGHTQGISCLSLSSSKLTRSRLTTLGIKGKKLSVGGGFARRRAELDRAEDRAEIQAEDRVQESADLGEPECYYFEEYEAPRMNPSVVAAHKRIGLLQRFNKWQGKAMDKMVSKIKSLEKKVSGSSSKKKKDPWPPLSLGVGHSSPLKGGSPARPHRASSFEPREGEDNTQRRRKTSKARRSSSTTGLDRVQTEETQLDRAEGRVDLEEPLFENPGFEYDPTQYQDFSQTNWTPTTASSKHSSSKAKGATHTLKMKKKKRRSRKLDRVRQPSCMERS
ncbi:unnamed protein product [Microthlaspi erraticum]|uniref:Arabidopsis retrotransposon Orf1 C-terminal domain-containing protein n=1 Tax=Microthlaspi erraticum TaxID=1685480 RepID=A0A6D2JUB2_9BRAS|nr:unnamed protein product [Microthlaspi erraticum]